MTHKILPFILTFAATAETGASQSIVNLDDNTFEKEIKSPGVFLLDVRMPDEYAEGHISGAANLDVTAPDFVEKARQLLPADKKIAVYCKSGKRSAKAAEELSQAGYSILNLIGGIEGWKESGKPVTAQ